MASPPHFREPARLDVGARVALVSPSGALRGEEDVARAEDTARALGWEPVVGANALARDGYFAGDTAARWRDFEWALTSKDIDGIWCLRGGYGAMRLLPMLSPPLIAANAKPLLGYSDITALHAAFGQAGVISYHAPVARGALSAFSRDSLVRAVQQGRDSCGDFAGANVLRQGTATGRLVGGNLSLAAALCGTPWAFSFREAIVMLEDVNEPTYRIDRMLTQLRLAGAFDGCRALVFGRCDHCPEHAEHGSRSLDEVITECAALLGVPAVHGVPLGHIDDQWTLPLNAMATLNTDARTLVVHRDAVM